MGQSVYEEATAVMRNSHNYGSLKENIVKLIQERNHWKWGSKNFEREYRALEKDIKHEVWGI